MGIPSWLNWTSVLTFWAVLYALATVTQGLWKQGTTMWKVVHVILAISPGDFLKAIKTVGVQAIPPAAVLLLLVGCAAAPSPKVTGCAARYQGCVSSSADMPAYVACRALVDRDCLDGGP